VHRGVILGHIQCRRQQAEEDDDASTRFLHEDLRKQIDRLAANARRAWIAVPYLGPTADQILPLRQGDVLVVDVDAEMARRGLTDPRVVKRFFSAGVKVNRVADLHANV